MTTNLPSLEVLPYGSTCPDCGEPIALLDFCASCFNRYLQEREEAIDAQFAAAKKRARTWQLNRAVNS